MPHFRTMLTNGNFSAADLWVEKDEAYREVVVQIEAVAKGEVVGEMGRKKGMPFLKLRSALTNRVIEKPFGANATNCSTIASIAGSPDVKKWIGLWVTLYVTRTEVGREMRDCIRIKPEAAQAPQQQASQPAAQQPSKEPAR